MAGLEANPRPDLQRKLNRDMMVFIENKKEELNYLYDEHQKELQRAATVEQSQKDIQLIV